jgi:retron-type reverse transcriptase
MNTVQPMYEWNTIPWRKLERNVFKLQKRIYINHETLIKKLDTSPLISRIVKSWLKAGIMDKNVFRINEKGTPQGGVISPLLANTKDTKTGLRK